MNTAFLVALGILLPFWGTALGSAAVIFFPSRFSPPLQKCFFGFAAGVMQAAAVWSLLIPAAEFSGSPLPGVAGILFGMGLFLFGDRFLIKQKEKGKSLLALSVTLHNLPEGMAVGVAFAAARVLGESSLMPAMILSLGIAIQNLPEGAVISMPLFALGEKKEKAFFAGVLSGVVEPLGAVLALAMTELVLPILPFVLSFAAGAMMYVIVSELIPAMQGKGAKSAHLSFGIGFSLMMSLDLLLG